MKLIWTEYAASQLEKIYAFLAQKSEQAAVKLYNDILDDVEILCKFPQIAPIDPLLSEYSEQYRYLVARRHYKIIYYIDIEMIYIVPVFDCRQNPNTLLTDITKSKTLKN